MPSQPRFSAEKIARLAHLRLDAESLESIQSDLDQVLQLVDKLNEVELSDVEPFFGTTESDALRDDVVGASLPRQSVLRNAADQDGKFYRVPPVFK